jgi:hypothetical protein
MALLGHGNIVNGRPLPIQERSCSGQSSGCREKLGNISEQDDSLAVKLLLHHPLSELDLSQADGSYRSDHGAGSLHCDRLRLHAFFRATWFAFKKVKS